MFESAEEGLMFKVSAAEKVSSRSSERAFLFILSA